MSIGTALCVCFLKIRHKEAVVVTASLFCLLNGDKKEFQAIRRPLRENHV